ncbi:hypothetical protein E8E13_009221 [Curvularia kusanoi]|uniref:C2H2-type domain-containing protein n=1 Tax=Curvularia kusanoi TaxID=90978 RepID=A0A9P4W810_CURKU|nr:hypothetical protein E8E13_009221 [Curvularia kusanoi]
MARFYSSDEPWNPLMSNPDVSNNQSFSQPDFGQYRQSPRSDIDNVSDSGYQTQRPPSVLSNEPGRIGQELPPEFIFQARSMNVKNVPNAAQPMLRTASDQKSVLSQHSSRSGASRQLISCPEPTCLAISKCKSEHKKHMLKHVKNFMCTERGCKRAGQGFSTINDLDRHRKSVHKIGVTKSKSYKCAAADCGNKDKIWPRLDNFKQHVQRMHKSEDVLDLIKLSEYNPHAKAPETHEALSTDPALFAGIGGSDSNYLSPSAYLSYQPTLSFTTSSISSTADISPSTASHDMSFSPFDVSAPAHESVKMHRGLSLAQSIDDASHLSAGRRQSTKASPTSEASTTTLAPGSHEKRKSSSQTPLSDEPQTKSEQVQLALAKGSKTDIDLAEFVKDLSESDKQAMLDLLKQQSAATRLTQRRSTQDSASSPRERCDYAGCTFAGRTCDLNKHKKRHAKPYGCTYPKCHKRFGAKSDWKRHENSQHFQLDAFHCDHLNNAGAKCGMHWHRSAQFKKHLQDKHKITDEKEVDNRLQRCKIGKNCQGQFWCGFCRKIKPLKSKRNAAWDERFDHIAHHFEKEMKSIDNWLCVEANRTKKDLQAEVDRKAFPDDNDMEVDAEAETDDDAPPEAQDGWGPTTTGALDASMQIGSHQDNSHDHRSEPSTTWYCVSGYYHL